jgi:hypothetical protein
MLTVPILDDAGRPMRNDHTGERLSVTVLGWHEPPTAQPPQRHDDDGWVLKANPRLPRAMRRSLAATARIPRTEFEAVVSRLVGWTGITCDGAPAPCTPLLVRAWLRHMPDAYRQIRRVIDDATVDPFLMGDS